MGIWGFHGNLGEDSVEQSFVSAEDFAELSVRRNLEMLVVGWEHGFSFLGLNCGSLEMEMAASRVITERLDSVKLEKFLIVT
ncbi:hypothetical protein ACFX2C_021312 [Malus domestica]